jgi:Fe2+ transport system protein FeoA
MESLAESCEDCLPCLDAARKKLLDRARAQKAALEDGMTMAEALPGSQVMIDSVKGSAKFRKQLAREGLDSSVIVTIEKHDEDSGELLVNIKGYHVALAREDASKVLVKPM